MSKRILAAPIFDALEAEANRVGGVGRGWLWDNNNQPCCIHGVAMLLDRSTYGASHQAALLAIDVFTTDNDRVVAEWQVANPGKLYARMPFDEWCYALGVTRAPSTSQPAHA